MARKHRQRESPTDFLKTIPDIAERVLGLQGASRLPLDFGALEASLDAATDALDASSTESVLSSPALRTGLLKLLAWAARQPPPLSDRVSTECKKKTEFAGAVVDLTSTLLLATVSAPAAISGQLELARGVLRTQALHAAARQVAQFTEGLIQHPPGPLPSAKRLQHVAATLMMTRAHQLMIGVLQLTSHKGDPGLLCQLAAALAESHILEHCARAVLMLRWSSATQPNVEMWAALAQSAGSWVSAVNTCHELWQKAYASSAAVAEPGPGASGCSTSAGDAAAPPGASAAGASVAASTTAAKQLYAVMTGLSARHAAMAVGLAVLSRLEGEGAPERHGHAACSCISTEQEPLHMFDDIESSLLCLQPLLLTISPPPPTFAESSRGLGPAASTQLLLRMAHTISGSPRSGARGSRGLAPATDLARTFATELGCMALSTGFRHLHRVGKHPQAAAVLGDVWRLAAALLRHEVLGGDEDEDGTAATCACGLGLAFNTSVSPLWDADAVDGDGAWRFPADAPASMAAAVAGGALPFLEHLLRRSSNAPERLEAPVARTLTHHWFWSLPLLAYGESLQAGAFVATVSKLLRRADPRALLSGELEGAGTGVTLAFELLRALEENYYDAAASPALGRLALVMSLALPSWLPELSRLVREAAALDQAAWNEERRTAGRAAVETGLSEDLWTCLERLLRTLTLFGASGHCQPRAADAESSGPASTSPSCSDGGAPSDWSAAAAGLAFPSGGSPCGGDAAARADGGDWRAAVLEAADVVPLVGAALGLLERWGRCLTEHSGLYCQVGTWAVHLARTRPDEVRGAARGDVGPAFMWRPIPMVFASSALYSSDGWEDVARRTVHIAKQLEAWAGGGEGSPSWQEEMATGREVALDPVSHSSVGFAMSRLLVPPAEARRRLGLPAACSYPACASLAGDSEAGARLQQCGRCGQASYCCRDCQTAHWRAGHKEACSGGAGASKAG
ncbi:hypothetical protein HYH03_014580 [Edaphochlamys debaryana]|uniref:phytol kinase n=1 Tax=Edaphochlamys debaryana TaxID=47281 RepID=A0A835XMU4_9CHLO|nr:hypothetical protein HYH03_014580 [Edaphochlamys debaryana]|eukprot:KAG2486781.1 hypothetical protein HYH03_014580 [Edaphochlamys debaryana]